MDKVENTISSLLLFTALPEKVKRVWIEEWGEPKTAEVLVVSWATNVAVFSLDFIGLGFQVEPSSFPSMPDLRYCTRVRWKYTDDIGGCDGIYFLENSRMTDNREESWVDEVAEPLIALSKMPSLEDKP